MTPVPSATQWGSPAAPKRALLIHGNSCSSHTWEAVAQGLARAGFFVVAPNLLGHGNRPTDDFHLNSFAQDLHAAYFANGLTYDVIIGHSLGGTITLALLPLLEAPQRAGKTAVVLVDPGIEFSDEVLKTFETVYSEEIRNVRPAEAHMKEHPTWTRQDAVSRVAALYMAQADLPKRIFAHIKPFAYKHLFNTMPSHVEMTVLLADPELSDVCPPELIPDHPQIRSVVVVKGSSHWIQHENPEVIVQTAVDEVKRQLPGGPFPYFELLSATSCQWQMSHVRLGAQCAKPQRWLWRLLSLLQPTPSESIESIVSAHHLKKSKER